MIRPCLAALYIATLPAMVWAQDSAPNVPTLSTILTPDWASGTISRPHANVAPAITIPEIMVTPLADIQVDAVGLFPTHITGLPRDLWGMSDTATLARLMRTQPLQGLPAIQQFTQTLALAELDPPFDATQASGVLFLARLDMLLARGALAPAQALIERTGATEPEVFRRWFDISLLTDQASRACAAMAVNLDIAPSFSARIFCLAQSGDWAAALSLGTGEALGRITTAEADLLARFLDPELFETARPVPTDVVPTPLSFQMRRALGERPDTTGLPLAFVHADLSNTVGWRARLDAAERLMRAGAIEPTQWIATYTTDRVPAASGAIWDRVNALQTFDAALVAQDTAQIDRHLAPAWAAVTEADLGVAFATVYAERLLQLPLTGQAATTARRVGLLSPLHEYVAQNNTPQTDIERFAFGIARGLAPPPRQTDDLYTTAIAAAFANPPPSHRYAWFIENNRLGEALLRAALVLSTPGADPDDVTDALALYRSVGLEGVARNAALQMLLLP